VLILTVLLTAVTFKVQPGVPANLALHPWGYVFPAFALVGLVGMLWFIRQRDELKSFLSSCLYIVGMLTSAVFGLYPLILPASTNPAFSLTVDNAKAPDYGLKVGLAWWVLGMILVAAYHYHVYRSFSGKVTIADTEKGY
jgi:cytochrome d ubiquinol oxidase subunit II